MSQSRQKLGIFLENKAFLNSKTVKEYKIQKDSTDFYHWKNDYENHKFATFEEFFDNFGRSHKDMI